MESFRCAQIVLLCTVHLSFAQQEQNVQKSALAERIAGEQADFKSLLAATKVLKPQKLAGGEFFMDIMQIPMDELPQLLPDIDKYIAMLRADKTVLSQSAQRAREAAVGPPNKGSKPPVQFTLPGIQFSKMNSTGSMEPHLAPKSQARTSPAPLTAASIKLAHARTVSMRPEGPRSKLNLENQLAGTVQPTLPSKQSLDTIAGHSSGPNSPLKSADRTSKPNPAPLPLAPVPHNVEPPNYSGDGARKTDVLAKSILASHTTASITVPQDQALSLKPEGRRPKLSLGNQSAGTLYGQPTLPPKQSLNTIARQFSGPNSPLETGGGTSGSNRAPLTLAPMPQIVEPPNYSGRRSRKIAAQAKSIKNYGKTAKRCDPNHCKLPLCWCGGTIIPGDLPKRKTPQLVMITFDDSVHAGNEYYFKELFGKNRTNPNGCPIRGTFYVSHDWTDYSIVNKLFNEGHEIASHSINHLVPPANANKSYWEDEISGQRDLLVKYGAIPLEEIKGMRAPFLQIGGNAQLEMLQEKDFSYDSSIVTSANDPPCWPYTLDYAIAHRCMILPCPTNSFPGLWEVPLVHWADSLNSHGCAMIDACSVPETAEDTFQFMLKNFYRHYRTNRAPFGIFLHAAWFTHKGRQLGFEKFLDNILKRKNVWVVTTAQTIKFTASLSPKFFLCGVKTGGILFGYFYRWGFDGRMVPVCAYWHRTKLFFGPRFQRISDTTDPFGIVLHNLNTCLQTEF